jgi:hemerythrin-like domain-containing protein
MSGQKQDHSKESEAFKSANEMALVHNILIRSLNSIYLQAPNIKAKKDIDDFVIYMYAWSDMIHAHHETEEKVLFPLLEQGLEMPGFMEKNVEEHQAFANGLTTYDAYVGSLREGKEQYDGAKVLKLIDSFGEILTEHLKGEIETILSLEQYTEKLDWVAINKAVQKKAVADADLVCHQLFSVIWAVVRGVLMRFRCLRFPSLSPTCMLAMKTEFMISYGLRFPGFY